MGPTRRNPTQRLLCASLFAAAASWTAALSQSADAQTFPVQSTLYAPSRAVLSAALPDSPGFLQAASAPAQAAGTASIAGVISDVRGGIVPGATIALLGSDGRPERSVTSESDGRFSIDLLSPGTYKLLISAEGLETFEPPAIPLKPGEHYNLPETALPIATANQTVNVVLTQEMIADQEIHDETKQRVLGVLPNFFTSYQWNAAPMNAKQKFKLTFRAEIDPVSFAIPAVVAGIEQERGTFPDYGGGPEGFGKRYGAAYGDAFIGRTIGQAVLPSIFRQDARYFYMGAPSTTGQRFRHALAFSVTARSDKGHDGHLVPNYSHILGNFIAGYISKTYHPDANTGIGLAVQNALIGIGGSAVQGVLREFVLRHVSTNTAPYAQGKSREIPPPQPNTAPAPPTSAAPANP